MATADRRQTGTIKKTSPVWHLVSRHIDVDKLTVFFFFFARQVCRLFREKIFCALLIRRRVVQYNLRVPSEFVVNVVEFYLVGLRSGRRHHKADRSTAALLVPSPAGIEQLSIVSSYI